MEAFLVKSLRRIRREAPRRMQDLKDLCDQIIGSFNDKQENSVPTSEGGEPDRYFEPLRMACESGLPRLMEIALSGIHFLLEHGYIRGRGRVIIVNSREPIDDDPEEKTDRLTFMDVVVETICKCSDDFDDSVQLQVIKALLVAVTSSHCEVHEASLLLSIRACFHIHLISKNQVNKITAKAALTQMLSVVNQRMENFDARTKAETAAALSVLSDVKKTGIVIPTSNAHHREGVPTSTFETSAAVPALLSRNGIFLVENSPGEEVEQHLSAEEIAAASPLAGNETSKVCSPSAAVALAAGMIFPSIAHKDAFLLFRALCKLSMKGLHENDETGSISDPIALQNKILSLELILHTLQTCGPAFRTGEKFVYAIRNYLCVSLLGNCTSQVAQVVGLSLQIFVSLMDSFKDHLKSELEVFVATIFLRILESENSTYDHKLRVLDVFHRICKDPSVQVEIFINYDCDFEAIDLFRRIVDGFAKIAKNPILSQPRSSNDFISSTSKRSAAEEQNIRVMGLTGLVIVLQSLLRSSCLWPGTVSSNESPEEERSLHPSASTGAGGNAALDSSSGGKASASSIDTSGSARPNEGPQDQEAVTPIYVTDNESAIASVVHIFDRKQKVQEEIETGILKFNLSPKKGLQYLASLGHIEMTPLNVASFLHQYQDRLDKTAIGDYLGREREYENGFCLKVLHEYVDIIDFAGMAFDLAIRHFLAGFRLPGEAQKIDRLMEKFAERYYLQNRDVFASADMAFILAFSTIMLQTNLHNPAIRDDKRMTKDQFLRQNKGISADGELPDELLSAIYDRIAAEPISINCDEKIVRRAKKEENVPFAVFQVSVDKRKKDAFSHERKEMVRTGEAMFKQASKKGSVFVRNTSINEEACSKPMFEVVWAPMIGVLSQLLETSDETSVIEQCLLGFHYLIRLACRLDFPTARNALCNALSKFTTLETVREMHPKNVECVNLLLRIALTEGDYLEESWFQILLCVSQLARLQLFANRLHTDDVFFSDGAGAGSHSSGSRASKWLLGSSSLSSFSWHTGSDRSSSGMDPFTKLFSTPSRAETLRQIEEANAEMLMREVDPLSVDQIFLSSSSLGSDSVYFFVKCLCEISTLEISSSGGLTNLREKDASNDTANPRVFSLQKLVEVADVNMPSRGRLAWGKIWSLLAHHFTVVGTQDNLALAMYAIDSLKQLSMKFLQKEEFSNFNFQRVFLKPFEVIMTRSKSTEVKDLVLRCIDILIRACAANIRSGWRSIFAIFEVAASQESVEVAIIAFEIIQRLLVTQFGFLIYDFVELVNCLVAFVSSIHISLSVKALGLISQSADHLAAGDVSQALGSGSSNEYVFPIRQYNATKDTDLSESTKISEDVSVFRLWWPLLLGVSTHVADARVQVREKALATLSRILHNYAHLFSLQTWEVIFRGVLFPMLDSAKTDIFVSRKSLFPSETPSPDNNFESWVAHIGGNVLTVCVDMLRLVRSSVGKSDNLLSDFFSMLESCICQDSEALARLGLQSLIKLISLLAEEEAFREESITDLVCVYISRTALKNLCLDFGDAGYVKLHHDPKLSCWSRSPVDRWSVHKSDKLCPVAERRNVKSGSQSQSRQKEIPNTSTTSQSPLHEIGLTYLTPFGEGKLVEIIQPNITGAFQRQRILLSWGATLFTSDSLLKLTPPIEGSSTGNIFEGSSEKESFAIGSEASMIGSDAIESIRRGAMTSMVVSLGMVNVLFEFIMNQRQLLRLQQIDEVLYALEALYRHASSINDDQRLRLALNQLEFMSFPNEPGRLPDLVDQEIISLTSLVRVTLQLYSDFHSSGKTSSANRQLLGAADTSARSFADSWIRRVCAVALMRYINMECELADPLKNGAGTTRDHSRGLLHSSYESPLKLILEGIAQFSPHQFAVHGPWLLPILPSLITSSNYDIRVLVGAIYSHHVNPLALQVLKQR